MRTLLFLAFVCLIHFVEGIRDENTRSSYFNMMSQHRLTGHLITTTTADTKLTCARKCLRNELCKSCNFKAIPQKFGICQLNSQTLISQTYDPALILDADFVFISLEDVYSDERPKPVDGKWTEWSEWTNCGVTCGGGVQSRNRTCTNPPPAHGGKKCDGTSNKTKICSTAECPVDGNWIEWSEWTQCSVTCGVGVQSRNRTCTNPPPAHGGRKCKGASNETKACNAAECPVDGNWTEWSEWTNCSVTCGGGVQSRNRTCTNPPPAHGGKKCDGIANETKTCNTAECPDCTTMRKSGVTASGIYSIDPDSKGPMNVSCDMTTDGGGWTVIQRRVDSSTDFYVDWPSYKQGFGTLTGNLWLGNDNIYRLTASGNTVLRVELEDWQGNTSYAEYGTFEVDDESNKYRLTVSNYSGTAGDSLGYHDGMFFSTKDRDDDRWSSGNCARGKAGGWWYNICADVNLNGLYLGDTASTKGTYWLHWKNYLSLKNSVMMVRSSSFTP